MSLRTVSSDRLVDGAKLEAIVTSGDGSLFLDNSGNYTQPPVASGVDSVNGYTGVVVLTKSDIGLSNLDNTSDASKPISTDTQTALDGKVDENVAITGDTKTKITYDAKGLVTAGADATTADIADSSNKRYVTDAQLVVIGNTSGTNTGDQTTITGNAGSATVLQTARTINGVSFDGSANITVAQGGDTTKNLGYLNIPQGSVSANYTFVLADSGKHKYHPSTDTTARTWTIPANASVAYPIGTALTIVNDTSAGALTISITTDTLVLAGAGTTGSRTLAANGIATAIKVTSTRWMINGTNLT